MVQRRAVPLIALLGALALPASAVGSFAPEAGSPFPAGSSPFGVQSGDFNGDSRPDLAVANASSANVTILLRQAGGGFAAESGSPFAAGSGARAIAIADFNADTRPDLAVVNSSNSSVSILLRQAAGGFAPEGSPLPTLNGPIDAVAADFNGDNRRDLAVAFSIGVHVFLRQAGGGFAQESGSPILFGPGGASPLALTTADFNGDTRPDLAIADEAADGVRILLRQAGGGFAPELGSPFPAGDSPRSIAVADFNADNRPDLAVPHANGLPTTTILLRQAAGGFAQEANPPAVPSAPSDVATGDFNSDTRPDLAVTSNSTSTVSVFLRQAGGGFAPDQGPPVSAGASPQSVAVSDLNADTRPDLAVANSGSTDVSVLLNTSGGPGPDTSITGGPAGPTADSTPTFTFASTPAGASFECRVDTAAFSACTSPFTSPALTDGSHTFEVRAKNGSGTDPTPASRTFTVDTVPPDTTIQAGPPGSTVGNSPSFSFSSTEAGSSFRCRLDGAAFAACASPYTAPALALGSHNFAVRATDPAGNVDATPATLAFTVVPSPPAARMTISPNPTCVGTSTLFDASASSGGAGPITNYRFEYPERDESGQAHTVVISDGTSPQTRFEFSWNLFNPGHPLNPFDGFAYRDDADVTLTVRDASGATASVTQHVNFARRDTRESAAGCPAPVGTPFLPASLRTSPVATAAAVIASLGCPRTQLRCVGSVAFLGSRVGSGAQVAASRRRKARVVIAVGSFNIAAGETEKVRARLTKRGRRLLRGRRRLRVRVSTITLSPTGKKLVRATATTLKVRSRK